jgi:hypothetical protein
MGWKPMFLVVLVRLLVLPALGCVIVVGVIKLGWYDPPDPVYTYILLQQVGFYCCCCPLASVCAVRGAFLVSTKKLAVQPSQGIRTKQDEGGMRAAPVAGMCGAAGVAQGCAARRLWLVL